VHYIFPLLYEPSPPAPPAPTPAPAPAQAPPPLAPPPAPGALNHLAAQGCQDLVMGSCYMMFLGIQGRFTWL